MKRLALTVLVGFVAAAPARSADYVRIGITDQAFSPRVVTVPLGTTVIWFNVGNLAHTVTQDPLLTRWDTGTIPPGQARFVRMKSAGNFRYHDDFHWSDEISGAVRVPVTVRPAGGKLGTWFVVRVGTERTPLGFVHDVQRRYGSGRWRWLSRGTRAATVKFLPAWPGAHWFRARLRRLSNDGAGRYSPPVRILVTR